MRPDAAMTTDVIRLVLGVARLGEKDLRGWWKGHAIDRTGQYVLSSVFRRTWKPATLELDMAAASRMHRELLGRSTALHLFSDLLPFRRWAAAAMAAGLTRPSNGITGRSRPANGDGASGCFPTCDGFATRAPPPAGRAPYECLLRLSWVTRHYLCPSAGSSS
jgi:hypothetical protein